MRMAKFLGLGVVSSLVVLAISLSSASASNARGSVNDHAATTGSISGTVSNQAGALLEGASIDVGSVTTYYASNTTSAANGTYTVSGLPAGTYFVQFGSPTITTGSYAWQFYNATSTGSSTQANATAVTVTAGSTTSGINAVLAPGAEISGIVTNQFGAPQTGVAVLVLSLTGANYGSTTFLLSSGETVSHDGTYSVSSLQPGSYYVEFGAVGSAYVPQYYNDTAKGTPSKTLAQAVLTTATSPATGINAAVAIVAPKVVSVTFAAGSAVLSSSAEYAISTLAYELLPRASIVITGFAKNNFSLAARRARAVAKYLSSRTPTIFKFVEVTTSSASRATIITIKN